MGLPVAGGAPRFLNVHEHVSMELMSHYGIPVPRGSVVTTPEAAEHVYESDLGGGEKHDVVIKAQVLAGGRGLGTFRNGFQGGVHVVTRPGQARDYAEKMLNEYLVTKQTGEEGRKVSKVFLMERLYMRREMYLSILLDRASAGPVVVASPKGGTSIEDVAESDPSAIMKMPIDMESGPTAEQAAEIATFLGMSSGKAHDECCELLSNLYRMFKSTDATLIEVNPLAETPEGHVFVCDAKINFDDNAEFRQSDIFAHRDPTQEDAREVEAAKYDLNYIGLDGTIGCMVNGAGLAMATMDIIKLHGGEPANFLDVGGGATEAQVQKAFEILNSDPGVKAILVNIFGGIMRCDVIAQGIINAAAEINLKKPIVLRLQGTNVEEARALIDASGYRMIMADDLDVAARKAVKVADIVQQAEDLSLDVKFELPL
jgi:succinyl-CoA synthetase beta subunit